MYNTADMRSISRGNIKAKTSGQFFQQLSKLGRNIATDMGSVFGANLRAKDCKHFLGQFSETSRRFSIGISIF